MAKKYLAILVATVAVLSAGVSALAFGRLGPSHTNTPGATANRYPGEMTAGVPGAVNTLVAPAPGVDSATNSSTGMAYPSIGAFQPGPPPYGSQAGGDGLSAFGVAYREIPAPAPDAAPAAVNPPADLIHAAYTDALKRAQALAAGSGVSLGKLVSLSDYAQAQPLFKSCPVPGPLNGKPLPGNPNGSGAGATTVAPPTAIACTARYYMVVWVVARYQLA